MSEQKPNHICKVCGKAYFACEACDKYNSWRSVACCTEHYIEYLDLVTKERNKIADKVAVIETTDEDKTVDYIENEISEEVTETKTAKSKKAITVNGEG